MNTMPKRRFYFFIFGLLAVALCILIKYAWLILGEKPDQAEGRRPPVERGFIVDRNGKILASQVRRYDIYIRPPREKDSERQNEKIDKLAYELAPVLDMDAGEIRGRIASAKKDFVLKKQVTTETYELIQNLREESKVILVGVIPRAVPYRFYPERNLAAQIVGFVGAEYQGQEGIEYAFNTELSGKENNGRGSKVVLTIDANVQYILEKIADSTLRETRAESVIFMAMDPRNGEILGSAVVPSFDPNNHNASSKETYQNLVAIPPYEPGSVLKPFTISALMDSGAISEHSVFTCNGAYEMTFPSGEKIRIVCADGRAHGRVGPREIIINSCNVGAAYAAEQAGNKQFYDSLLNLGFGKKTGAWVNMETAGLLREPGQWSGRTKQTIAFGQEIAVSALQIMQAASAIANGGVLVPPKFVSKIISADGKKITPWENPANASRQVLRPETARKMLSYMADTATTLGTGWRASIEDIHIAVKTGTSQYRDPVTRGYSKTDFIASCVALLPAEAPSLALYVAIMKPRGETYGGRIAAPAIREAADQLINYLGIYRPTNPAWVHSGNIPVPEETLPPITTQVPDFYGLSKKTLLPLLLRNDLTVEIRGEGWVRRQSPPSGTAITADTVFILELE